MQTSAIPKSVQDQPINIRLANYYLPSTFAVLVKLSKGKYNVPLFND